MVPPVVPLLIEQEGPGRTVAGAGKSEKHPIRRRIKNSDKTLWLSQGEGQPLCFQNALGRQPTYQFTTPRENGQGLPN